MKKKATAMVPFMNRQTRKKKPFVNRAGDQLPSPNPHMYHPLCEAGHCIILTRQLLAAWGA
jgi:hypothetical protein